MGLKATAKASFTTNIPEDIHSAVCIGVYGIGTVHNKTYSKDEQKVIVEWELPNVRNDEGFPQAISSYYTLSLGEKSILRRHLQGWRGRKFTDSELESFELFDLLGKPCQLQVIHNLSGGNTYANVDAVLAWPRGMEPPKPHSRLTSFSFEDGQEPDPLIPERILLKIKAAPEYQDLQAQRAYAGSSQPQAQPRPSAPAAAATATQAAPARQSAPSIQDDDGDDCPF